MNVKREKRILKELKELNDTAELLAESGIYTYYHESDINKVYALLIGTDKTPYQKGFYFFEFTYPEKYPMSPPLAKYMTQGTIGNINIRFNPNLYVCGKVCLSMLNTWAGPGWCPCNTMNNVLIAIQGIVLLDEPLRNEPGYENEPKDSKIIASYSKMIEYANIKIAVLNMLFDHPPMFNKFSTIIKKYFLKNIDYYKTFVREKNDNEINKTLIDSNPYQMKIKTNYTDLIRLIDEMEVKVMNDLTANEESTRTESAFGTDV
jgi:ubiquitin-protein ligase